VKKVFRTQDKLLRESTRGKKGLALVCLFLFFELFLELRVGLLKVVEIFLEEPRFSHPLQLQLVEFPLKIHVLLICVAPLLRVPGGHSRLLSAFWISVVRVWPHPA
jgi:hypothetical protein